MLAKLRLLPAMYGQDLKAIALKQKYTGDVRPHPPCRCQAPRTKHTPRLFTPAAVNR